MFRSSITLSSKAITVVPKPKPIIWRGIPDYDLDVNSYKIPSGLIDRYTQQLKKVLEKNKSNK